MIWAYTSDPLVGLPVNGIITGLCFVLEICGHSPKRIVEWL